MSKTKGIAKLVINSDTSPTPQEPSFVETESNGVFVHHESANKSKVWLSNNDGIAKVEYSALGLDIGTELPNTLTNNVSINFKVRGSKVWEIEGDDLSSGDILPVSDNLYSIGRTGFNLKEAFTRKITSDSALDFSTSSSVKWSINTSGHFYPYSTNVLDIGTTSIAARGVFTRLVSSDISQALIFGIGGTGKWYIASGVNSALSPISSGYDLGTVSTPIASAYTQILLASNRVESNIITSDAPSSSLSFRLGNINKWSIDISSNFVPNANLAQNIGSGSLHIQDVYLSRAVRSDSSNLIVGTLGNGSLDLYTNNALRWSIDSTGSLNSNGTQYIKSPSGNLGIQASYTFGVGGSAIELNSAAFGLNIVTQGDVRTYTAGVLRWTTDSVGNIEPAIATNYRIGNANRLLELGTQTITKCESISGPTTIVINPQAGGQVSIDSTGADNLYLKKTGVLTWAFGETAIRPINANRDIGSSLNLEHIGTTYTKNISNAVGTLSLSSSGGTWQINGSGDLVSTTAKILDTNGGSLNTSTANVSFGVFTPNVSSTLYNTDLTLQSSATPPFGIKFYTGGVFQWFIDNAGNLISSASGNLGKQNSILQIGSTATSGINSETRIINGFGGAGNILFQFGVNAALNRSNIPLFCDNSLYVLEPSNGVCGEFTRNTSSGSTAAVEIFDQATGPTGGGNPAFRISSNGVVKFYVDNDGNAVGTSFGPSDIRLKDNIIPLNNKSKDIIMSLNPVSFTWLNSKKQDTGFIAQEVFEVIPESVLVGDNEEFTDYTGKPWAVSTSQIMSHLTKALQIAFEEIEELRNQLTELKNK
jgi:hypothetical protein